MSELSELFSSDKVTFEAAKKYFGEKLVLTPKEFYALSEQHRSRAFTVSGYSNVKVLKKFYDELLKAIEEGTTVRDFKNSMNKFLTDKGYEGITNYQADNIFRTNVQTAYQIGHYQQMTSPMVKKLRPFWQYDAVNDLRTRPSHLAMHGKVFPADSPVWDTWYPPNGYRCRCGVTTLSKRQVEERELTVETEAPTVAELPDGRVVQVLPDPNFSANPAKVAFEPDLSGYPEALKKAYENQKMKKN